MQVCYDMSSAGRKTVTVTYVVSNNVNEWRESEIKYIERLYNI